jgi:hypothetical protein
VGLEAVLLTHPDVPDAAVAGAVAKTESGAFHTTGPASAATTVSHR